MLQACSSSASSERYLFTVTLFFFFVCFWLCCCDLQDLTSPNWEEPEPCSGKHSVLTPRPTKEFPPSFILESGSYNLILSSDSSYR